ncbi:MAG: hypothetical protein V1820_02065 [archaeon]
MAGKFSFVFSDFLTDEELQEIANSVKASPKGKLIINCLYLLAGNGHYRGASAVARAAEITNAELHRRKLLSESEQIVPKLIYAPALLSGIGARLVEWAARDLYETLSRALFFQYSWNEASREMAENSRLDTMSIITRKLVEISRLKTHLEGVVLSFHFVPGDIFYKYPQYANRFAIIPLDDAVYPSFVRKETGNYFVGSEKCAQDVIRALSVYGVPSDRSLKMVKITGQPISPDSIRGAPWGPEETARETPRYVVAMGGAGAQLPQMEKLLSSYTKYSGKRPEIVFYVGHHFEAAKKLESLGCPDGIRIVKNSSRLDAIAGLAEEIRDCDALITKPSELSFYPAPIYSLPPIGYHEEMNIATAILEKRGRVVHSLWDIPLDPVEELAIYEDDLERMQKSALTKNPNLSGAFRIVKEACKLAPAGKTE